MDGREEKEFISHGVHAFSRHRRDGINIGQLSYSVYAPKPSVLQAVPYVTTAVAYVTVPLDSVSTFQGQLE